MSRMETSVATPVLGQDYGRGENTSGQKGLVPAEVQGGWNWGAFWFSWIWLFAHKVNGLAWGLLAANVLPVIGYVVVAIGAASSQLANPGMVAVFWWSHIVVGFVMLVLLGVSIYLGITGNKLGWQHRRFASVADYKTCERIWTYWGLGIFLVVVVLLTVDFVRFSRTLGETGTASVKGVSQPVFAATSNTRNTVRASAMAARERGADPDWHVRTSGA